MNSSYSARFLDTLNKIETYITIVLTLFAGTLTVTFFLPDTMTVSSVAYICSPPFVPMMAAAMKNRSVLAAGLAVGVVGYAAGNYLGFLMARLLEVL